MPAELAGRRIALTGGRGFLGQHTHRALERLGASVIPLGRGDYDLIEQAQVRQLYADLRPDMVIHLAAAVGGIGANIANPGRFLYENAMMGLLLLEEARRAGVRRFVLISTTCAYPQAAPLPMREADLWAGPPTGATGPYGVAKRMLHEAARVYQQQYGLDGIVLLLSNLYGPGDHYAEDKSHVIPALIRRYTEAVEAGASVITHWGSGAPTREFIHVEDAARAIALAAARHHDPEPVNIGTGIETSIRDLTTQIGALVGYQGRVEWDTSKPDGQPRRFLDVSQARAFGFEARIALQDGLRDTIEDYRAQRRRSDP